MSLVLTAPVLAGTVLAVFGRVWWYADLFSHFRVQYLIVAVGISLWLLIRRRVGWAMAPLTVVVVNLAVLAPQFWLRDPAPTTPRGPTLRLLLANVETANTDHQRIVNFIRSARPDVVVLEEVDDAWLAALQVVKKDFPFTVEEPRDDNFGIVVLSRHPMERGVVVVFPNSSIPSIEVQLRLAGSRVTLFATHPLPPGGAYNSGSRNAQLAGIAARLAKQDSPAIVIGDLNTTPWNHFFRRLLRDAGLRDSSRGWGLQASWPTSPFYFRIPLDHCLVSPSIAVLHRELGPDIGSDHFPLLVDVALPATAP